ncbi:MAG: glycosyltransferase family 4 protein [Planctomycetia bacterium]|nr:MAG: glycosyltransferase family 4 protein [Planctomycetia bacterium]
MRIGFQVLSLKPGSVGGQEVFVRRLLSQLTAQLGSDRLVLFARPQFVVHPDLDSLLRDRRVEVIAEDPEPHYGPGYSDWILRQLDDVALDVVCFPLSFFYPRPLPMPVVLHVPDIQHEYFPQYFSDEQLAWRRERIAPSVALADAVVTYSDFSARCLRERMFVPADALHVIPSGGFTTPEIASLRTDWDPAHARSTRVLPDAPFVLYPAGDWPHKNHETLLQAFALLVRAGRPEHLVLTGMISQRRTELMALVERLGIAERVHLLGCVRRRDLVGLYSSAAALAFPSRFEGFGQPLVEAMQMGCPVVASRAAGVMETAGNAAAFAEDDPVAWAERLIEVLANEALQEELVRRGARRAAEFDWDHCARRHMQVLRSTASRAAIGVGVPASALPGIRGA